MPLNELGQPIGAIVPDWKGAKVPPLEPMTGRTCRVEPLEFEKHGRALHEANQRDAAGAIWTYMPYGPFDTLKDYGDWVEREASSPDPLFHAIIDRASDRAVGVASYLRINPSSGSIEVGHICFSPELQSTVAATEAMYLMMARAFDELGYRRYEWKCNARNEASCRAARRLGLTYEGTFRQATVSKGRNRDTAWFAAIDSEWPALKAAFENWLAPDNFDANGRQKSSLSALTTVAIDG